MKTYKDEIKKGDVFYFSAKPTVGSEQKGNRPGIVVSNDVNNRFSKVINIVYVTTQAKAAIPEHVSINSLPKPGIALCEQIHTVSIERIKGRKKGKVTPEEIALIDKALMESLGISADTAIEYAINLSNKAKLIKLIQDSETKERMSLHG